ncbi:dehydratase [Petrotoga sp. 9PW.55.5.1]|uniref:UxaA family hydrolase n=1 Tax=Petrotoga sp. 9PW.55.5.1 TaxID=1308979 RepID=UPI000DC60E5B|nr:UxaA family hydrolase [Petrotoga sp. 9PW.55.5.1]RAO99292.1 dehydratase [Petrotoga sp. 9PW.55.5.1]
MAEYKFLVHKEGDSVGVASDDLKPGEKIKGRVLEGNKEYEITVLDEIVLGHKISLKDIEKDEEIIEYGEKTGIATKTIKIGEEVHVHNIKSRRWGGSK